MREMENKVNEKDGLGELFWKGYEEAVIRVGVPRNRVEWYCRWVKSFAARNAKKLLHERSAQDVKMFLAGVARSAKVEDWQVEQVSEALRRISGHACAIVLLPFFL